ncbi:MAG: DUF4131 domain-containing protein, partial [Candidatus Adiutrix sp.]
MTFRTLKALSHRPLLLLLPVYMLGIKYGWDNDDLRLFWGAGLLSIVAAFLLLLNPVRQKLGGAIIFCLFLGAAVFSLGALRAASSLKAPLSVNHVFNLSERGQGVHGEKPFILGGVVVESLPRGDGSAHRLLLETREIIWPEKFSPPKSLEAHGLARINIGGPLSQVHPGDYVRLPVILRPLFAFKNPKSPQFEKSWAAQGLWVGGFVKSPWQITSWPNFAPELLGGLKTKAAQFIDENAPMPARGLLAAQLLGRRG